MIVGRPTPRPASIEQLLGAELMGRLDRLDVLSRKVFAGKLPGERRSKRRGRSVEFDDYRTYVPGDDLRHLDWNVFARLDRFFVKLFHEEEDLSLSIVLDRSRSMDAGEPSKLVFAHRLAMALGYVGLVNLNRVSVAAFGDRGGGEQGQSPQLVQLAPIRGRRNVRRLGEFLLASLGSVEERGVSARRRELAGGDLFRAAMRGVALSHQGRGVVIVISDFLGINDPSRGLNDVAGGRHGFDSYAVQVLAPGELEPEREAEVGLVGDLRLTDAESGRAAEVTVSAALIGRYKERLEAFLERFGRACAARDIAHSLVRSDADLDALMLGYLRRRGLLG